MRGVDSAFPGPDPAGRAGPIVGGEDLPVSGHVDLALSAGALWDTFQDVPGWARWNPCIWRAGVVGGRPLGEGVTISWVFNAIRPLYPYKMPARATIVEFVPRERVTWEVSLLGFHAVHGYRFADLGEGRSRFGSWEVAEGPMFRATRRFWMSHFRYVCRSSLEGARTLG